MALVFAMVGSSYAAVPLYRRFCQATGYGGTVQRQEGDCSAIQCRCGRWNAMEVCAHSKRGSFFYTTWVRVKPGESALASYTAENRSSAPITGVSTYNVTPYEGCSLL
ncbi:cytochrome c oxidase assembly protein COX11, mitochondrial-like isoform X2 [Carya illinoinensis]|uniref:cytochrome c oxidase assembly protein COX11, mitochondrial-like isoform X2 n=1 Tax=Carya illinoinensis TaxID=32201 RepID=UPI001C71FBBA|nr:cytochrome c oxidase assembly protein COX11, mitochondrial-like isoform X2 [Carya illinoinensis]